MTTKKTTKKITEKTADTKPAQRDNEAIHASVEQLDFEQALAELDAVVARMEAGDLTLEASLATYERGVLLTRHCQQALQAAELKIQQLDEDGTLSPFTDTAETEDEAGAH